MLKYTSISFLALTISLFFSCRHEAYVVPISDRTGDPSLCFDRDILPIFLSQCAISGCHDAAEHEKGYILDSYENIMKKGIAPGNAIGSRIYQSIIGYTEELMPEDAPPLSASQIGLIERWINAGALKDSTCYTPCDSNNITFNAGIKPLMEQYCVGCHSGNNPQGGLMLNNYTAVKDAALNRNLVHSINYDPGYKPMPQGLKLSACQIRQIEKWVAGGMPDN